MQLGELFLTAYGGNEGVNMRNPKRFLANPKQFFGIVATVLAMQLVFNYYGNIMFQIREDQMYKDRYNWLIMELSNDELLSMTTTGYKESAEFVFVSGTYETENTAGSYLASYFIRPLDRSVYRRSFIMLTDSTSSNMSLSREGMIFSHKASFKYGEGLTVKKSILLQVVILIPSLVILVYIDVRENKKKKEPAQGQGESRSRYVLTHGEGVTPQLIYIELSCHIGCVEKILS